mmetsp:Transcript_78670/g.197657  ORF Transcript_78670/g.197657 Transcript_78670/m.197657 type:complete len:648 (-) Transcript_78670:53-1996(-)
MAAAVVSPARPAARAAARAECVAMEVRHEEARKAALHEKNLESQRMASDGEEHRRQVDTVLAGRKAILDEMRATRDDMHGKLRFARKQGRNDVGSAERALARAGKRALDARTEAEAWHAKAAEAEAHRRATWERNQASFNRHKMGQDTRIAEAEDLAAQRADHGRRITEEAAAAFDAFHRRHKEHCATQERHAAASTGLRVKASEVAEKAMLAEVDWAKGQAARCQALSARDMRGAHEVATVKVASARQDLADRHRQCQDALVQERACAAQARMLAAQQKDSQEVDQGVHKQRLEANLNRVNEHLAAKAVLPVERAEAAEVRNEISAEKNRKLVELANARADKEEQESQWRLERAKVALANLQAQCAAQINELLKHWDEAKRADASKVQAATARTEEVLRYCQECLQHQADHNAKVLERSKNLADSKVATIQERVATIANLSEQRVVMMQQQSQERRRLTEEQLAELQRHTEDVRKRCAERLATEGETAKEKVRIARERNESTVARAELRAREAEHERDLAQQAFDAVIARCVGAAAEARRRGLFDVADIIEPPPQSLPQDAPPVDVASEQAPPDPGAPTWTASSGGAEDLSAPALGEDATQPGSLGKEAGGQSSPRLQTASTAATGGLGDTGASSTGGLLPVGQVA